MAEDSAAQAGDRDAGNSRFLPVMIGVVLVVGSALGVVAVTAPASPEKAPEKIELDLLPAHRWGERYEWTFNLAGGAKSVGRLKISFDYKAIDTVKATDAIVRGEDRAKSDVRILLLSKTKADLSATEGVIQLRLEVQKILNLSFFPTGQGKVSDVYILELLFQ